MRTLTLLVLVAATALASPASASDYVYRAKAATIAGGAGSGSGGNTGTPQAIALSNVSDALLVDAVISNAVAVAGHPSSGAQVSLSGDASAKFRICADASCASVLSNWGASPVSAANGNYVQASVTTSSTVSTASNVTLSVGSVSSPWKVTTRASYPQIAFTSRTNQAAATYVATEVVQLTGYGSANVSVSGGGSPSFRVCADASCASEVRGFSNASYTVAGGQYVQGRVLTGDATTVTAQISLSGGPAGAWSVQSRGLPSVTMTLPSGMQVKFMKFTKIPTGLVSVTHMANTTNTSFERFKMTINTGCTDMWGFGQLSDFYMQYVTTSSCLAGRNVQQEWARVTGNDEYVETQFVAQGSKSGSDRTYSGGQITWTIN